MRDERCNWRLIYYMEMEVSDRQLSLQEEIGRDGFTNATGRLRAGEAVGIV